MKASLAFDDYPLLPIPDQKYWGENYAVTFFDPASGIGGMISIGRWVVQNELWRSMVFINFPNDRVLVSRNFGRSTDPQIPHSGVLDLETLEVGKKFVFRFNGPMDERTMTDLNTVGLQVGTNLPVKFELTFESDSPIWDMHAGLGEDDQTEDPNVNFNSPDGHIEQNGRMTGRIFCGEDEAYLFDGVATRDHSRGPRNVTPYKTHIWTHGVFPSGRSFNLFAFKAHGVPGIAAGGAVGIVDGVLHHMKLKPDSAGWLERPEQLFQPLVFAFESDTLGPVEIEATQLLSSVPFILMPPADHFWSVPIQSRRKTMTWINEQKVIWRWDGEEGAGHLERGNTRLNSADPIWQNNFRSR